MITNDTQEIRIYGWQDLAPDYYYDSGGYKSSTWAFNTCVALSIQDAIAYVAEVCYEEVHDEDTDVNYYLVIIHLPECPATKYSILAGGIEWGIEKSLKNALEEAVKLGGLEAGLREWESHSHIDGIESIVEYAVDKLQKNLTTEGKPDLRATIEPIFHEALSEGMHAGTVGALSKAQSQGINAESLKATFGRDPRPGHLSKTTLGEILTEGFDTGLDVALAMAMNLKPEEELDTLKCHNHGCRLILGGKKWQVEGDWVRIITQPDYSPQSFLA